MKLKTWDSLSLPPVLLLTVAALCLALWPMGGQAAGGAAPRERLLLDAAWKFHLGNDWGTGEKLDKAGESRGPAGRSFSDTGWRTLDLPHDWAIELPFDQRSDMSHGYKPVGPGFPANSVGWYRRAFTLPAEDAGKRLWLEFDGAFRDTRVFVNGYFVGHHESGYSSFRYDITDVANCGGRNTVAVRVDASEFEGWFYEGAGIYRHVWLVKTGPWRSRPTAFLSIAASRTTCRSARRRSRWRRGSTTSRRARRRPRCAARCWMLRATSSRRGPRQPSWPRGRSRR